MIPACDRGLDERQRLAVSGQAGMRRYRLQELQAVEFPGIFDVAELALVAIGNVEAIFVRSRPEPAGNGIEPPHLRRKLV